MASPASIPELAVKLHALRNDLLHAEADAAVILEKLEGDRRESTKNLIHYLSFRQHDLRGLQADLSDYGLSSLGRLEAQVLPHLDAMIETLTALLNGTPRAQAHDLDELGGDPLADNAEALLGAGSPNRDTRIMVTMPSEAATHHELIRDICDAGMDVARINCAHDDEIAWAEMIRGIREASTATGRQCVVSMDLGGPKLRTGPLEPGPRVVKVRPTRNDFGEVTTTSLVRLESVPADSELQPWAGITDDRGTTHVPVSGPLPSDVRVGDTVRYVDARGRNRKLRVTDVVTGERASITLESDRTIYWQTGGIIAFGVAAQAVVGELPAVPQALFVRDGDTIRLVPNLDEQPATQTSPHTIGCSLPEAFRDAQPGQRVLFDDGKISGTITEASPEGLTVLVSHAGVNGTKLRAEKGINLPDTDLDVPALTDEDRSHLPFIAANADIVNMSFVQSAGDVAELIAELEALNATNVGITLKIETETAFRALPQMLLEAMRWPRVGVMIARGDLAVEVGFERLAEVQEEILWLCEAAHVPVIWATQVLDSLAKTGLASRAEVTDAAMSRRAECVMLNKGPYIVEAIDALDDILERMGGHVSKKRTLLRSLRAWDGALDAATRRALREAPAH